MGVKPVRFNLDVQFSDLLVWDDIQVTKRENVLDRTNAVSVEFCSKTSFNELYVGIVF